MYIEHAHIFFFPIKRRDVENISPRTVVYVDMKLNYNIMKGSMNFVRKNITLSLALSVKKYKRIHFGTGKQIAIE
jgi:hypothetical protein